MRLLEQSYHKFSWVERRSLHLVVSLLGSQKGIIVQQTGELLALKYFVQYYKHYLLGRKFVVRSDHESLKWLYSLKEPKHRIARWIEVLSEFDFELEYRPGRKHSNADAMSRCPNPRQCSCDVVVEHDLPCKACKKCLTELNK